MAAPTGAPAAQSATIRVISHLVLLVYSYGRSTSGRMAKRPKRPLRWLRGTMDRARDLVDEARDWARVASVAVGVVAAVASGVWSMSCCCRSGPDEVGGR